MHFRKMHFRKNASREKNAFSKNAFSKNALHHPHAGVDSADKSGLGQPAELEEPLTPRIGLSVQLDNVRLINQGWIRVQIRAREPSFVSATFGRISQFVNFPFPS